MGSPDYCMRCKKKWAECKCPEGPTRKSKGLDWEWDDVDLLEDATDQDLMELF